LANLVKVPNAPTTSAEELNLFFEISKTKKRVHELYCATELRFQFGRAIELQILLGRAIKLEEHGFKTKLLEIFDPQVSPRNIAILATYPK